MGIFSLIGLGKVRCIDCEFLIQHKSELSTANRRAKNTQDYSVNERYCDYSGLECFRRIVDIQGSSLKRFKQELKKNQEKQAWHYDREQIIMNRACKDFCKYVPGYPPEKHLEIKTRGTWFNKLKETIIAEQIKAVFAIIVAIIIALLLAYLRLKKE